MNDDDMLSAARCSLTGSVAALSDVHMDQRPDTIMARARRRRLGHVLPGIGAGGLALGIALALSLPGGHPAGAGSPTAAGGSPAVSGIHVNLASWSVNTSPTGLVTVTIRQLKDPARLSKTLADAGVPVVLTSGSVCTAGDQLQISRVVRKLPGPGGLVMKINPKAMPAGSELVIGIGTLRIGSEHGPSAAFGLEKRGSRLDCHGKAKTGTN